MPNAVTRGSMADSALGVISAAMAVLASVLTVLLVLAMVYNLILRNARGGVSIATLVEGTEVLIVMIAVLGSPYALRQGAHVSTSVVTDRLSGSLAGLVILGGRAISLSFLAVVAYATAARAWNSYLANEIRFGVTSVPAWPARIALALGFALLLLEMIALIFRSPAPSGVAVHPPSVRRDS